MKGRNINLWLIKIDRVAAWILLGTITIYFLSGYGMTKGLFDSQLATFLHEDLLPLITLTAFVLHTFSAVRIAFIRKRIWNNVSKMLLLAIYIVGFLSFIYFELFYQQFDKGSNQAAGQPTSENLVKEEKVFTSAELAKYNGQNGNPAYVAVDGIVYDVSSVFQNGTHYTHYAGQELTSAFYKKHVKSQIIRYPIVGAFENK